MRVLPDHDLLKVDEVAAYLQRSPATLRAWRVKGIGPRSAKIGRHRLYRKADVLRWEDERAPRLPDGSSSVGMTIREYNDACGQKVR